MVSITSLKSMESGISILYNSDKKTSLVFLKNVFFISPKIKLRLESNICQISDIINYITSKIHIIDIKQKSIKK